MRKYSEKERRAIYEEYKKKRARCAQTSALKAVGDKFGYEYRLIGQIVEEEEIRIKHAQTTSIQLGQRVLNGALKGEGIDWSIWLPAAVQNFNDVLNSHIELNPTVREFTRIVLNKFPSSKKNTTGKSDPIADALGSESGDSDG